MNLQTIYDPGFSNQILQGFNLKELESMESANKLTGVPGFSPATRRLNVINAKRVQEAQRIWQGALAGEVPPFLLKEAFHPTQDFAYRQLMKIAPAVFNESMTSSDFTVLTDQILDKMVWANYQVYEPTWSKIAKVRSDIRDFRLVRTYYFDGGKALFPEVKEKAGFDRRTLNSNFFDYGVKKYEAGYEVSWEAIINDNLNFFQEMPRNMSIGGTNTIENYVTSLYTGAAGPDATLYTNGSVNGINNIITGNPAISIESIQAALAQWMNLTDADGVPITMAGLTIVVGDGTLYVKLKNIINTLSIDMNNNGGTTLERIRVQNWMAQGISVIYNPWIRKIATTNAATSWWMFADPNVTRPAIEVGFLSGYRGVQMYRKASNTVAIGGGISDVLGDFETMSTEYKGLIVFGGTQGDPRSTMASNGTGS